MIITDSLSSLQAFKSQKLNNPIVSNILHMCHYLSGHKDIIFCWVPSHIGIQGNERADVLAKAALDKTKQFYYIPYTDFKYNISVFIYLYIFIFIYFVYFFIVLVVPYSALTDCDRSVVLVLDDRPDPQLWGHCGSTHSSSMICFFLCLQWFPFGILAMDGMSERNQCHIIIFSLYCFKGFSVASWRIMQHVIEKPLPYN